MSTQELLENVKTWLDMDNEIRTLQKEIRDKRKMKKNLTHNLVGIMKTQDIDALNVPDGQLIYNKTKTKAPLSKKHLFLSLTNYFKNDKGMVEELTKFIMESSTQNIKQRFGIIGNDPILNRSIEKAMRVSPTDISVLVTGESGVGKESFPKIIHQLSHRKHKKYIAVNCGAIPEGTIDSELFGHEKGAFTGANNARKGYFEVADGGTIFLDEVGELPLTTQVRLLRVLENGEFIKVGSSQVQKTDIRIVAATNLNISDAIGKGKFREDLYYRLSTIEILLPPLRERPDDIHLLFRKC